MKAAVSEWTGGSALHAALCKYVESKREIIKSPSLWDEQHQHLAQLQERALLQLKNMDQERLARLHPENLMENIARCSVLHSKEAMEGALEINDFLIEHFPHNPKLLFIHAKLCRLLDDHITAVSLLEQALSIEESLELFYELYVLLMQRGSYSSAEQLRVYYTQKYDQGKDNIAKEGIWLGKDALFSHLFDGRLSHALVSFFESEKALTIVDFGCGTGEFLALLLANNFFAEGYDGNPVTPDISWGLAKVQNLAVTFDLSKKYDWVMCLEVAEHIPKEYEKVFVENLVRHCTKGILLSWGVKGQGGHGHFNEQDNDYVKALMSEYGFENDLAAEQELRAETSLPWYKNTLMVFRKSA